MTDLVVGPLWHTDRPSMGRFGYLSGRPPLPPQTTYRVSFPWAAGSMECPVEGCTYWDLTHTNPQIFLMQCHIWDMIVILEEGNRPHPRCPACDMFVTCSSMNHCHPTTTLYAQGAHTKRWWRGASGFGDSIMSVWTATGNSYVYQGLCTPANCDGRWMASCHR